VLGLQLFDMSVLVLHGAQYSTPPGVGWGLSRTQGDNGA
jgi:hypothetical protein